MREEKEEHSLTEFVFKDSRMDKLLSEDNANVNFDVNLAINSEDKKQNYTIKT